MHTSTIRPATRRSRTAGRALLSVVAVLAALLPTLPAAQPAAAAGTTSTLHLRVESLGDASGTGLGDPVAAYHFLVIRDDTGSPTQPRSPGCTPGGTDPATSYPVTCDWPSTHAFTGGAGGANNLLSREIGNYQGTVLIDALDDQDTARLKIEADGRWTVTLKPVAAARQMTTKASGKGDDVLVYRGPSPAVATIANRGTDNFAVFGYSSEEGQDLMVNEIGKYSGEVTVTEGTFLIQVTAGDGKWTINVTG